MANRINKNLRWVKRQCDLAKITDVLEEEILDAMNQVENEIAEVHGVILSTKNVTLNGSTETWALSPEIEHVTAIRVPSSWSMVPDVTTDAQRYEEIRKQITSGTQPRIILVRGNTFYVWPVGTNGDVITVSGSKLPTTVQVEGANDPTVDSHWDMTLRYGALALLFGGDWTRRYEEEMSAQAHSALVADGPVVTRKKDSARKLGF